MRELIEEYGTAIIGGIGMTGICLLISRLLLGRDGLLTALLTICAGGAST